MAHHSFELELADDYSVYEAIFIRHIDVQLKENKGLEQNYYNGRYWMKATIKGLQKTFYYLTQRQIYNTLLNLRGETEKTKKHVDLYPVVLTTDALNDRSNDKSLWYTFSGKFMKKYHNVLLYCTEKEAKVQKSDGYVKHPDREELESSLLQICNRLLDNSKPDQETLLQFCNRLYALKDSQSETREQSLIQFCKSYPITKLYMAYYKFVTHIKVIDLDLYKEDLNRITTTTATRKEDLPSLDQKEAVVVAVPDRTPPKKRSSYLEVVTYPDEIENGKLLQKRNYDATSEKDTQHLSQLAESYGLTSPELEKFMWEHSRANPDMQHPWIANLTELEKGLQHAKRNMKKAGSRLGFLRHFYFQGQFVRPSTHTSCNTGNAEQSKFLSGFSPEEIAAAKRQAAAARR